MTASSTAYQDVVETPKTNGDMPQSSMIIFRSEDLRSDSYMYYGYNQRPYNPDFIVQKKPPFDIYDQMRRDDQVKAVLWLKKFMVMSSGWTIEMEDGQREDIVDGLKSILTDLQEPDFGDALTNMLSHLDYGFSITEPVFDIAETDQGQKVVLTKLKTRAPHTFILNADDKGKLIDIEQYTSRNNIHVSPDRVLLLIHQYEFGVPYGISDLQSAYRAWFSKDIVIKFWNIYLERFGNPHIIGTIPMTTSTADKNKLLEIFKNLQAKTGILVPEGTVVDIKTPATGTTGFETAIDNYNMMIARSMLMPDLMGMSGGETKGGSFALGEKQFEMFFLTISKIRKDLENIVNRKIIRPLCLWNYGLTGKDVPIWKLMPFEDSQKNELIKMWTDAVKGKIWEASDEEINHFRKLVKFPVGDVTRHEPVIANPFGGGPDNAPDKNDGKSQPPRKFAKRELTVFEKRIDFAKIESTWDQLTMKAKSRLSEAFDRIKEGLIDAVKSKRIIEGRKLDIISDLPMKYMKDLQLAWREVLRGTFDEGHKSARTDMKASGRIVKMAGEPDISQVLEDAINERSYFLTGIERDELRKQAAIILNRVVEQGQTVQEAVHQLSVLFDDFSEERLETIVRTELTRAFNQGRMTIFSQSEQDGFIEAYQYSAIIDSRTTDICEALDGTVTLATDPYVDMIQPPRHYNCRSLLIPVVQGDQYVVSPHAVSTESLQGFDGSI